ncbi:hypothetical protein RHMOL_Rhmol11G0110700 [Rhododendron molle]|uniref:Uncharacterized protein n=1 Tax=Rhododendron molle TaxID=49168 RepID=A0ACC0LRW8_RHOML|nr:hypothetical protein RHMOL_Rhmol11G0110700 [Rhododendron molle]
MLLQDVHFARWHFYKLVSYSFMISRIRRSWGQQRVHSVSFLEVSLLKLQDFKDRKVMRTTRRAQKVPFLQVSLLKLRDMKDRKFMGTTRRAYR